MKDLKIEYRDGKFVELRVDGLLITNATAMHFSDVVGGAVPQLTLTMRLNVKESLSLHTDGSESLRDFIK